MRARPLGLLLALALPLGVLLVPRPGAGAPDEDAQGDLVQRELHPFLRRYCFRCHAGEDPEGELRLDRAPDLPALRAQRRTWTRVRSLLHAGEMPPPEAKRRPAAAEVAAVLSALNTALRVEQGDPGRVTLRRLNRREYDNTLRDLLGLHLHLARDFPDDDTGYGYDTVGDVLAVSPLLFERLLAAAERAADLAIMDYQPLELRVEAEAARRDGRGGVRREDGGWAVLSTEGQFSIPVQVPWAGEYELRAHVYGDQAGPEPVQVELRWDGKQVAKRWVRATRGAAVVLAVPFQAQRGAHRLALAFVNDYYRPEDPDPSQRDRNLAVDWLGVSGPLHPPQPPLAQRRYLTQAPGPQATPAERRDLARRSLEPLATRAFRRPPSPRELKRLEDLVLEAVAAGDSWAGGLKVALEAILVSPAFLYRCELDPEPGPGGAARDLNDYELASRLSYYLWSSMPDERLFELAARGELRPHLEQEARRLLDDPRASALVQGFFDQWLGLGLLAQVTPDPDTFPEWDDALRASMRVETERLCEAILREGRSATELLDARFTFVDERLARLYGIPGVEGPRFQRVRVPPGRGGVLTQASVLTLTSNPTRTSPVKRGKWLLQRILDDPPPPPPPGVGVLPTARKGPQPASMRERLELHRRQASCRVCHERMDALGFGLEGFDGIGRARPGADASGRLPDGTTFSGSDELRAYLCSQRQAFLRGLARQLMIYALGRGPRPEDEPALAALVDGLGPRARLADLVVGIVELEAFQRTRRSEEAR